MPQADVFDDPFSETRQQFLQGLATMATVGEAAARWAAVGIQNKAAEREREAQQDKAAAAAQREADALAQKVRGEREKMAASMDGDWLVNKADFAEAAAVWRTATVHAAGGDPVAARAAEFAEQRLRKIRPDLMEAYDRHHQAGVPLTEAMRRAAMDVWETDARANGSGRSNAQPHGNTPHRDALNPTPKALPAGGQVVNDLDAAVRVEAAELARHVDPAALDELQQRWRATGKLPAADPTQLLRDLAMEMREAAVAGGVDGHTVEAFHLAADGVEQALARDLDGRAAAERGEGVRQAGSTDDPGTAVDEHSRGQVSSVVHDDGADRTATVAAAVRHGEAGPAPSWAQAFPKLRVAQLDPAVAGKQPAQAVTATQTRGRGR